VSQPAGKATGEGTVCVGRDDDDDDDNSRVASFDFTVRRDSPGGPISGNLKYIVGAITVRSTAITSFVITGNKADFAGRCRRNGVRCTFTVHVEDNGAGTNDIFIITINGGPPQGGKLRSGNIRVRLF
jgi:hypothetical protein